MGANSLADASTDEHTGLLRQFDTLSAELLAAHSRSRPGQPNSADLLSLLMLLKTFLDFMSRTDTELGPDAPLPLVDADVATAEALRTCAALEAWLQQLDQTMSLPALDKLITGIALWSMRHDSPLHVAEPVVNALARHANQAETRQEVAAAFALMQGTVEHLKMQLGADLEQSNPERPWRILLVNFAITGIRSGDKLLASHAFSAFNAGLPGERAGFFAEALQLAESAGLDPELTDLIREQAVAAIPHH